VTDRVTQTEVESLLRELAPQALGAVARRYGEFADAEDAVQEALIAAAQEWPNQLPDRPLSWLIKVASRRLVDEYRRTDARRRREEIAASVSINQQQAVPSSDDSLVMLFLCCDDTLSPTLSIPLTLRAVAGLTTREIAAAYLVPEATMAQRISRAKARLRGRRFELPADPGGRLRPVCEVLYLLFNEGYTSSSGPDLLRVDLSGEAIRLMRMLHDQTRGEPEVAGLLALMLLTEARRPARTSAHGALVPLADQDRSCWDRALIGEGLQVLNATLATGRVGEYQLLAAIAALHDEAPSHAATRWAEIAKAYARLESLTGNPIVRLNRAVAVAMVHGPAAGLALLEGLDLRDSHRLYAVRAHLHESIGDYPAAAENYTMAAGRTANARERDYLIEHAARAQYAVTRPGPVVEPPDQPPGRAMDTG
jgi:RNA polymerase sigma factor (sigma-70 family)